MKNSIILMFVGLALILLGFLAANYWLKSIWLLLVPIGGFAIFVSGTFKFLKNLNNE
jgi:hypothetical protein